MLPKEWQKKVIDMNVRPLTDKDIKWADYVFISAMVVQRNSVKEVIQRVKKLGKTIVAGGPLFTTEPEQFDEIDHLVLNEAEITLAPFLSDLAAGKAQHLYGTTEHPAITSTPTPLYSLININNYSSVGLQYSRGCPFNCEFCDITFLDGQIPRTKSTSQLFAEMESLFNQGWRGSLFIVDDNFIGNKNKLKSEILPALIEWQARRNHPFTLFTEASINLVDDEELMNLMTKAGFNRVFIGIETPNEDSLTECSKNQNKSRDLVAAVTKIHNFGMEVMAGFIVGFDNDPAEIFKAQINFIQKSGIVTAMVGLLNAPRGTRLYQRMKKENRLVTQEFTGDNMDFSLNFEPKMDKQKLIDGYRNVLDTIYSPKHYYERVKTLLREYKPRNPIKMPDLNISFSLLCGLANCVWFVGIREKGRRYYWKMFIRTLFLKPRTFPMFVTLAVYGYHFRKVINSVGVPSAA